MSKTPPIHSLQLWVLASESEQRAAFVQQLRKLGSERVEVRDSVELPIGLEIPDGAVVFLERQPSSEALECELLARPLACLGFDAGRAPSAESLPALLYQANSAAEAKQEAHALRGKLLLANQSAKAEHDLDADRLRNLLESNLIGLVFTNLSGEVFHANDAFLNIIGYSREDLDEGRVNWKEITPPEYAHLDIQGAKELETQRSCTPFEKEYVRKDGVRVPVLVGAAVLQTARTEFFSTVVDLSEQRRNEIERRHLEAQVQQAQKLESLGVLAGGIAHDFNNLLMGILGNANLALFDLLEGSEVHSYVKGVEDAAVRAAELCKQLLGYSGKGRFVVEPLGLSEVLEEMSQLLRVSVSRHISFQLDLAPDLLAIEADVTQLRQVLMNLITNAADAIGAEIGEISISTRQVMPGSEELAGFVASGELEDRAYVLAEIADTGCGMDAETQARIFEPFFTTKETGHGLGLAAVQGILRGHNAVLAVHSECGVGTQMRAFFPCVKSKAKSLHDGGSAPLPWRGSGTVLLVDDEDGVISVCTGMLQKLGFDVLCAKDGLEALQIFADQREQISLIILDVTMPHMDGPTALLKIREESAEIPILLASGHDQQNAISNILTKGLASFIQKPYALRELQEGLHDLLGEA